MKERWKKIYGFKSYEVSDLGNVRSIDRMTHSQWGKLTRRQKGCVHKQKTISKGYKQVGLRKVSGGKKIFIPVHRLVAAAFLRRIKKGEVVNHLDFNPSNNALSNLEITTPRGNMQHSAKAGRLTHGIEHHSNKLTERNVKSIRLLHTKGFSGKKLAPEYGITDSMVYKIVRHESWKHVA